MKYLNLKALSVLVCKAAMLQAMLVLASGPAFAERADKNKPLNLEADSAKHDDVSQVMVVEGRVLATKGTLVLRAARIEQREDPEGNQFMVATGKPGEQVFFRQKREGLDEYMEGEASRIDFDGKADTVKLTGKAVIRRLRGSTLADETIGSVILFNNTTETLTVNGATATASKPAERVRMMLTPKPKTDAKTETPAPTGGVPAPTLRSTHQVDAK